MFSGIVECSCPVRVVEPGPGACRLGIDLGPLRELTGERPGSDPPARVRLGASVAVNGCCLTVAELQGDTACFDVVTETLSRTNLGTLAPGHLVNVERSLRFGDPVDGHLVAGHVEASGEVLALDETPGDVRLTIRCGTPCAQLLLPKGSVAVDGVSLTIASLEQDGFTVALVPHTLRMTTLGERRPGDRVNLEPDLMGRWILAAVERMRD
ncbi:MAG: riboflavin synthase [Planctomycetota bacterium]